MRDDARATRGRDVRRARDDDDGGRATGVRGETDVRCGARARGGVRGRGARGGGTRVRARGERGGVDERDDERRDDECDECDAGDARDERDEGERGGGERRWTCHACEKLEGGGRGSWTGIP